MNAAICLRPAPEFRFEAFASGLERNGFSIAREAKGSPKPDDVLVLWNRFPNREADARRYEAAGARVVIAENGYLGREWREAIWYSLSIGQHNGAGVWPAGAAERWDELGVELAPWREGGEEIVVLDQRGFGHINVRQPRGWAQNAAAALASSQKFPVRVRPHPGRRLDAIPLSDDLGKARCCVTWSSGAALKAVVMGIPVFHGFERWIGREAAARFQIPLGEAFKGDRLSMFRRLAWAFWRLDEIASGEAFRCLLR